ncbi:MAG: SRPBCC family protein [Planctomycetota bacterium]
MHRMTATRQIDAPVSEVFDCVSSIDNFSKAVGDIVKVEFTSEVRRGVGAKFLETRRMGKREATVELEVTEYVENDRIRLVSDAGGTVWDSVFTTKESAGGTELSLVMDAKPHKFLAKIFTPMIKGMVQKGVEKDMDSVKSYCERGA